MAVVFQEEAKSRSFTRTVDGTKLTLRYVCYGTDNELTLYDAARSDLPTFFDGLIRTAIGPAEFLGGRFATITIEYGSGKFAGDAAGREVPAGETPPDLPPSASLGEDDAIPATLSFTTVGGTSHITQSLSTVHAVKATSKGGGVAPDTRKAIGLRRDGVDGCDIVVPKMEFTWQRMFATITFRDMRNLMKMTAKTNNAIWKGFQVGELLFLGSEGQSADSGGWSVTYRFAFNENLPNGDERLVISKVAGVADITLPSKKGWDYLWCAYEDTITGDQIYPLPIAAYVEQVYHADNFANLGLGA